MRNNNSLNLIRLGMLCPETCDGTQDATANKEPPRDLFAANVTHLRDDNTLAAAQRITSTNQDKIENARQNLQQALEHYTFMQKQLNQAQQLLALSTRGIKNLPNIQKGVDATKDETSPEFLALLPQHSLLISQRRYDTASNNLERAKAAVTNARLELAELTKD